MASHDDARADSFRSRRKFRPIVDAALERREVMTATPLATGEIPPVAVVVSADTAQANPPSTTVTPETVSESPMAVTSVDTSGTTGENTVTTTSVETPAPVDYGDIATTSAGGGMPEMYQSGFNRRGGSRPNGTTVDWNTMAGWSWLTGTWKSNTKIDFMQTLAQSMGAKNIRFPSIPSMDTWIVGTDSYIGRTALGAQQQPMPLDGLVIKPGGTGKATSLAMTSADGTPPVELPLTSVKGGTAVFTGSTPIFETVTGTDGKEVTTTTAGAPVRVNVTRRNANSMRITSEMLTGGKWIRMFTYTATKTRAAKV